MSLRIDLETLKEITNLEQERNIYIHPNPIARDIFWQRLEILTNMIKKEVVSYESVLDFGGGSGVFSYVLSEMFRKVDIVDLDTKDAVNIKQRFSLDNVSIYQEDISNFQIRDRYPIIVATDVLEHFKDLSIAERFINRAISADGYLAVTLPTENWIYELGRKIVRKQKPIDHYHSSKEVISYLESKGYEIVKRKFSPRYLFSIPLFEAVLLKSKNWER